MYPFVPCSIGQNGDIDKLSLLPPPPPPCPNHTSPWSHTLGQSCMGITLYPLPLLPHHVPHPSHALRQRALLCPPSPSCPIMFLTQATPFDEGHYPAAHLLPHHVPHPKAMPSDKGNHSVPPSHHVPHPRATPFDKASLPEFFRWAALKTGNRLYSSTLHDFFTLF